jgi:hypothetical protein
MRRLKLMNVHRSWIFALALVLVTELSALAGIEWLFNNGDSPSAANVGSGMATINPGAGADGYSQDNPLSLGTASGYWDLGRSGSIVLASLGITSSETYTLKVYQWVDPAFGYPGTMSYSLSGGGGSDALTFFETLPTTGPFGSWEAWSATIDLSPGQDITLTGPGGLREGAIVDKVMLTVVPEPATLIAGALLLVPFTFTTIRIFRQRKLPHA